MSKVIVSVPLFMRRRYTHYNFFPFDGGLSFPVILPSENELPVVSEKHNSKNIWHNLSHVLVRVLRKESVWGQYISAFSRWSLWVIDFVFMGISMEVISCRAPVILLRSNARGTRRQHSNSIMFAMEPSLLCENNTIEDSFLLFSCNRLLVKTRHWCGNWLPGSLCFEFLRIKPGLLWMQ